MPTRPSARSTRTASTPPSPRGCGAADADLEVRTATLDEPEQGLTDAVLGGTDVLTWWGHVAHDEVTDDVRRAGPRAGCSTGWAWSSSTRATSRGSSGA